MKKPVVKRSHAVHWKRTRAAASKKSTGAGVLDESAFAEIVGLIHAARQRAYQAVNTELVGLYWQVGGYISSKLAAAEWGEGVVDRLAQHLARVLPGQRGFTRRNLFRMRQFFEIYQDNEKVTPLVTQLPWTHNLVILTQSKRPEEREFYLRMAVQQRWSKRELERQFRLAAFEHAVLTPPKLSPPVREIHGEAASVAFKDVYALEFLGLPADHNEADLHRGLLADRDARKPHESPSIGLLLCASKDNEVVEYALSRSLSPALIAEYQTKLPDKRLLAAKLHEFYALSAPDETRTQARTTTAKGSRTKAVTKAKTGHTKPKAARS